MRTQRLPLCCGSGQSQAGDEFQRPAATPSLRHLLEPVQAIGEWNRMASTQSSSWRFSYRRRDARTSIIAFKSHKRFEVLRSRHLVAV
jgi:hypothetical protein